MKKQNFEIVFYILRLIFKDLVVIIPLNYIITIFE